MSLLRCCGHDGLVTCTVQVEWNSHSTLQSVVRAPSLPHCPLSMVTASAHFTTVPLPLCLRWLQHWLTRVPRRLRGPCPSHRSRTAQRLQAPCPPQSPLSSISSHVPVGPTCDVRTQMGPVPPTRHATTADASTQLSISEFLQLCFTKHPLRRTVPLRIHEDLREAQTPAIQVTRCQPRSPMPPRSCFAEFLEKCHLSSALPPRPRPSPTLLLAAATQTPPYSVASADATNQLTLTEFFLGCICSKDPLGSSVPPKCQQRLTFPTH